VIEHQESEYDEKKVYEFVLNPPKGTVNNQLWAEITLKAAERNNIVALIVRPAGNLDSVAAQQPQPKETL
jgi:hypothetical protein